MQCQTRLSACSLKNGDALRSQDTVLHDCQPFPAELSMILAFCQVVHISAPTGSMHLDPIWQKHVAHVSQNHCIMTCFLLPLCCKSLSLHCLPCVLSLLQCQQYKVRMFCAILQRKDTPSSSHEHCELNPNAHVHCELNPIAHDQGATRVTPVLVNVYTMSNQCENALGVSKCPCWCCKVPCVLHRRAM